MKIYHKNYFIWGIIFLIPVPLFALGILEAEPWQWFLAIGLSAKFLFAGLSEQEGKRRDSIAKNYQRVSRELFGKYARVKTNLPWFILGGFFIVTLLIRFLCGIVIPVWIAVCFVIVPALSVFYSIGLDRRIQEQIEQETDAKNDIDHGL